MEIRSHDDDWMPAFERELGWDLEDGLILERHTTARRRHERVKEAREAAGVFAIRDVDVVRAEYDGPFWDVPTCPFVGPRRAFLAFEMESPWLARRFGCDAGRAARGLVLDLGPQGARRATPLVHRTVDRTHALIDLGRLRDYGATRSGLPGVMKYGSDMLVFDDGPYIDYVVAELAALAKSDARRDHASVELWRYTSSFTGGSECFLFD